MYPGLTHIEKESFSFDNYDVRGFTYMEKRQSVMTTQDVPWPHSHRKRVVQF